LEENSRTSNSFIEKKPSLLTALHKPIEKSGNVSSLTSGKLRPCLSSDKSDSGGSEENMVANFSRMSRLDIGKMKLSKVKPDRASSMSIGRA